MEAPGASLLAQSERFALMSVVGYARLLA